MEVAISESQSAYDNTSQTHQYGDLTSNVASALSTYDSALSVLGSTSEAGAANLDAVRKSVAESIIVYNIANQGLTLDGSKPNGGIEWNENGKYYTVYYKDSQGRELSEIYQYNVDTQGNVTVNKADIKYNVTNGTTVTVDKDHNAIPDEIPDYKNKAPETSYVITSKSDGKTDVIITVNGKEYVNPNRQINPDGTISYILRDTGSTRELFVVKADGSEGYYTTFEKTDKLLDDSNEETRAETVKVNNKDYTVAGGGEGVFTSNIGKYVVVQDEKGNWHKLVQDGNEEMRLLISTKPP